VGRAAAGDGLGTELVMPGFVAVDLAQPVQAPCADSHAAAPEGPMSTASPDTWAVQDSNLWLLRLRSAAC